MNEIIAFSPEWNLIQNEAGRSGTRPLTPEMYSFYQAITINNYFAYKKQLHTSNGRPHLAS